MEMDFSDKTEPFDAARKRVGMCVGRDGKGKSYRSNGVSSASSIVSSSSS